MLYHLVHQGKIQQEPGRPGWAAPVQLGPRPFGHDGQAVVSGDPESGRDFSGVARAGHYVGRQTVDRVIGTGLSCPGRAGPLEVRQDRRHAPITALVPSLARSIARRLARLIGTTDRHV